MRKRRNCNCSKVATGRRGGSRRHSTSEASASSRLNRIVFRLRTYSTRRKERAEVIGEQNDSHRPAGTRSRNSLHENGQGRLQSQSRGEAASEAWQRICG